LQTGSLLVIRESAIKDEEEDEEPKEIKQETSKFDVNELTSSDEEQVIRKIPIHKRISKRIPKKGEYVFEDENNSIETGSENDSP